MNIMYVVCKMIQMNLYGERLETALTLPEIFPKQYIFFFLLFISLFSLMQCIFQEKCTMLTATHKYYFLWFSFRFLLPPFTTTTAWRRRNHKVSLVYLGFSVFWLLYYFYNNFTLEQEWNAWNASTHIYSPSFSSSSFLLTATFYSLFIYGMMLAFHSKDNVVSGAGVSFLC